MFLREWLNDLNKLIEYDPEVLDSLVVYAEDDEGNVFKRASYSPTTGFYDEKLQEFSKEQSDDGQKCVCLN